VGCGGVLVLFVFFPFVGGWFFLVWVFLGFFFGVGWVGIDDFR